MIRLVFVKSILKNRKARNYIINNTNTKVKGLNYISMIKKLMYKTNSKTVLSNIK